MSGKMSRRDFVKKSSAAICGVGFAGQFDLGSAKAGPGERSKVVEVHNQGSVTENRRIDKAEVRKMLNKGMQALAGEDRPWPRFIGPKDRIGLKINTLGRPLLYTHHELVLALIEELVDFGVKENNIIVWDRFESHMSACKFKFNTSNDGVRYYGTESESGEKMRYDSSLVYNPRPDAPKRPDPQDGAASRFSEIFTKDCDKIINMAILKDHGLSGVTLCLKNLAYGLTDNNSRFHGSLKIGPFIADICAYDQVKKKVVLHMIDALEGCYDGGPAPRDHGVIFAPKILWLGTDPVSLDTIGLGAIEAKRKEKGLLSLAESGNPADHIGLAAKKGLGIADAKRIDLIKINLT